MAHKFCSLGSTFCEIFFVVVAQCTFDIFKKIDLWKLRFFISLISLFKSTPTTRVTMNVKIAIVLSLAFIATCIANDNGNAKKKVWPLDVVDVLASQCDGTSCDSGCCHHQNWFCCPDNVFCAETEADCP